MVLNVDILDVSPEVYTSAEAKASLTPTMAPTMASTMASTMAAPTLDPSPTSKRSTRMFSPMEGGNWTTGAYYPSKANMLSGRLR